MKNKAILVVSFGTSHNDTCRKTIDLIERDIQQHYPEYVVYRAFTSKIIIKILADRDHIHVSTVEQAMKKMYADGIKEVIVQPTHILNGIENDSMIEDVQRCAGWFDRILFGAPLLHNTQDYQEVIEAFGAKFAQCNEQEAILCMGHGTAHYTNSTYAALDYMFKANGYHNIYMGTVEAYPALEDILPILKAKHYKKVVLIPFMIVAGDHAKNDMAGAEEDSWRCLLEKEKFQVECVLEGLGENPAVRKIFVRHIGDILHSTM